MGSLGSGMESGSWDGVPEMGDRVPEVGDGVPEVGSRGSRGSTASSDPMLSPLPLPCSHWPGLQSAGPRGSCPPAVSLHLCFLPPSAPFQALDSTVHPGPASVPSLVTRCWDWPATGLFPARDVHPEGAQHPYESECGGQGLMPGAPRRIWEKLPGGYLQEAGFEPHLGQAGVLW